MTASVANVGVCQFPGCTHPDVLVVHDGPRVLSVAPLVDVAQAVIDALSANVRPYHRGD